MEGDGELAHPFELLERSLELGVLRSMEEELFHGDSWRNFHLEIWCLGGFLKLGGLECGEAYDRLL